MEGWHLAGPARAAPEVDAAMPSGEATAQIPGDTGCPERPATRGTHPQDTVERPCRRTHRVPRGGRPPRRSVSLGGPIPNTSAGEAYGGAYGRDRLQHRGSWTPGGGRCGRQSPERDTLGLQLDYGR